MAQLLWQDSFYVSRAGNINYSALSPVPSPIVPNCILYLFCIFLSLSLHLSLLSFSLPLSLPPTHKILLFFLLSLSLSIPPISPSIYLSIYLSLLLTQSSCLSSGPAPPSYLFPPSPSYCEPEKPGWANERGEIEWETQNWYRLNSVGPCRNLCRRWGWTDGIYFLRWGAGGGVWGRGWGLSAVQLSAVQLSAVQLSAAGRLALDESRAAGWRRVIGWGFKWLRRVSFARDAMCTRWMDVK